MKLKKLIGRLSEQNPFGIEMREESAFPEDTDYDDFHTPSVPACPIIRYDNVSYVCTKRQERCVGDCRGCEYGVRI